jgi:dTDP-4-amino-4,6-dideoxygalactose transaminase
MQLLSQIKILFQVKPRASLRQGFDTAELQYLVDASLDFWLTTGRFAAEFEQKFAEWMGVKHCLLVNSGSSANLLALTALTSPQLKEKQLQPGMKSLQLLPVFRRQ